MIALIVAIASLVIASIPIVFLAKANARENERQRRETIEAAKAAVEKPLRERIAELERDVAELQTMNREQARQIANLERELRRTR